MFSIRKKLWLAFAVQLGLATSAWAQGSDSIITVANTPFRGCPDCTPGTMPPGAMTPNVTDPAANNNNVVPFVNSNVAETAGLTPTMFGDAGAHMAPTTTSNSRSFSNLIGAFTPYNAKVADNASPACMDRVYVGYNYYNNAGSIGVTGNVETIGFEKTFLDGNASFGMRLPFYEFSGFGHDLSNVGDLSISGKYVLFRDAEGDIISAGMVITVPTGPTITTSSGRSIDPVFFQPFLGYKFTAGDAFVHGFSSIIVPTDPHDVTLWFNDLGVGYWLYRDDSCTNFVRGFVPTFEVHVNTPLSHRYPGADSETDSIIFADDVNFTLGGTIFFRGGSSLGAAYCFPVTGPRPFNGEAIVQFNMRF